ncbi:DUF1800 family protein [Aquiflexum sp.]|uniref:DUF1800 domain-containing protein n=1 Tax=Aquiflexum sp. TaxID=1872584 RepID=UPI003593EE6F
MFPIRPGQYRHLEPLYREVFPPDLSKGQKPGKTENFAKSSRFDEIGEGIEPFSGTLTDHHLAHILKRTRFGTTMQEIKSLRNKSLSAILDEILVVSIDYPEPINNYNKPNEGKIDLDVPLGSSFVNAAFNDDFEGDRIIALKTWMIGRILSPNSGIQEKMLLFWWNFLPIKLWDVFVSKSCYGYIKMLNRHVLGNFKDLIKDLTMDPAMLVFLSGAFNNKENPDENYGRELQELFCIGKGKNAGYIEKDVQAAARVLTGWTIDWESIHTEGPPISYFNPEMHHTGSKTFSAFYGNKVIEGKEGMAGAGELDEMLEMIFATNESSKFIARKLYTFFVASEISDLAEANVITPMAAIIKGNNYNIRPALKALLSSAHFFHPEIMGSMIKSPMDFILGLWRNFDMPAAQNPLGEKDFYSAILWNMGGIGQEVGDPPNVAGWPPYYQAPNYDKIWINTDSITKRALASDSMIFWGYWISSSVNISADLLKYVQGFEHPEDPNSLIAEFVLLNLGPALSPQQIEMAKNILLNGQEQDYYWAGAWLTYMASPTNQSNANIVLNRLKPAFQLLLQMGESQLM